MDIQGPRAGSLRHRPDRVLSLNESAPAPAIEPLRPLTIGELLGELQTFIAGQPGTPALLLVELNDLYVLRESLGFAAAAALIDRFALAVKAVFGARARVHRFGDAALCVFLPRVLNPGHAVLAAERIRRCVAEAPDDLVTLQRLLRIGVSLHPRDGSEPEELLRAAQLAAAMARRRSEAIVVFDQGWSATFIAHSQLGSKIGQALNDGNILLYYQPKVRVSDRKVLGVEALMRWVEEGRTVATPDVFLPLVDEVGLSQELAWMSLTNAMRISHALGGLPVAVNITPGTLHHREFVEMIESALRAWETPPGTLTLELTEGALVADFNEAKARLTHLRSLGVRVSIDDFGTGYSSLSYFKSIPADELKIDKSFILRMVEDNADQRLVAAIIALAHQFDLRVIAEGVETPACLELLRSLGCDCVQGYLYAPAMDEDRLRSWLWETQGKVTERLDAEEPGAPAAETDAPGDPESPAS